MAIIVDFGVFIGGERGTIDLLRWIARYQEEEFKVSAVTIAELWHGIERATTTYRAKRRRYIEEALTATEVLPYTCSTARIHARLWAKLESTGQMIGDYDLIIAATAIEHDCTVATFNKRHFSVVKGLKVIEPS